MKSISLAPKEINLILGALNFWIENKQCQSAYRSNDIDDIATNGRDHDSLDESEVSKFIEDLNCGVRDVPANEELTLEQQEARGALLAKVFYLKKDPEHKDRFQTDGGSKTSRGVFVTAKRIIEEGK